MYNKYNVSATNRQADGRAIIRRLRSRAKDAMICVILLGDDAGKPGYLP